MFCTCSFKRIHGSQCECYREEHTQLSWHVLALTKAMSEPVVTWLADRPLCSIWMCTHPFHFLQSQAPLYLVTGLKWGPPSSTAPRFMCNLLRNGFLARAPAECSLRRDSDVTGKHRRLAASLNLMRYLHIKLKTSTVILCKSIQKGGEVLEKIQKK